jgi:hypothetical protein
MGGRDKYTFRIENPFSLNASMGLGLSAPHNVDGVSLSPTGAIESTHKHKITIGKQMIKQKINDQKYR